MNLCTNAAHAMGDKGIMEVRLSPVDLSESDLAEKSIVGIEPGPYLELSVSDTGTGMDLQTMERIFEPYYTTKDVGKGSGLGLAVVHGIVRRHDGAVSVKSAPGKGSTFIIYIPRIKAADTVPSETHREVPTGTERILLLDDEQAVGATGTAILERQGYKVTCETDSSFAIEKFKANPNGFDLVITDYTMPHLTGVDLAREARRLRPDIPILLCTGLGERITPEKVKEFGMELLMKPYGLRQLSEKVRKILDSRKGTVV
jgi:CheY-like chemotaxis protein